jgi:hypothetical protein
MALKFRRGTTAQQSGSLAFGEPYVNTTLGTLLIGGPDGDIILGSSGTGSIGNFGAISGSGLDITGNANIAGNLTLGGAITIGDASSDTINVIASVSSSIIPSITNAFDLGSEDYFWRDIYVSTGSIKFVGAAGNIVGTLTNIGNGLNLDAGIVTKGNSSFGTSSLAITSITGSLRVSGSITTIGASTATSFNGTINANNGVVSGSSQVEFNTINNNPFSQSATSVTVSKHIIPTTLALDLGSAETPFRDLYLSSASLYINGTPVISSNATELILSTDTGQSIKLNELGTDNITLQTVDGDIELKSSGGGDVLLDPTNGLIAVRGTLQIQDGHKITSSGGNSIIFGNDVIVSGSITTTGNINGVNLSTFSSSINTTIKSKLDADGVISGSSQITYANISSIPSGIISGSSQVTPLLPTGTVSGSSQVNADSITNFDTNVKDKLNADLVVSGSASDVKTFLSLQNVTNESKATMFTSPTFTGTPEAPTAAANTNSTQIATTAYVQQELTDLIGGASAAFDTLLEISASLASGDSTLNTLVDGKLAKASNLSDLTDTSAARTNLGVAIGTNVQAYNATLAAVAGGTYSGDDSITTIGTITTGNVTAILPTGVVSGSSQIVGSSITTNTITIGSTSTTLGGTSTTLAGLTSVSSTGFTGALTGNASTATTLETARTINGTSFNGSANITIPNLVSGSSQITAGSTTNFATDVKTQLNSNTVVSGSSQINVASTTGYSTISSHISSTSNPHSVTAAQVGLGNVTNESKATMFASPTFTGTVSGVTATHVGLGNVTNESKATMFSSPTFTGTVSGVTATHVGLGNVNNTSDANKPVSTAQQTALDAKLNINGAGVVSGSGQINVASTTGDIALGTRTSGNYVATITGGTGVSSNGATTGEGIAHTISIGQAVATTDNVRFASIGVGMAASGTSGRIDAANDIVAFSTSDIRFKENITPIENAIDKIRKISGNTYDWKSELKDIHGYEGNDVGVIAQEVEAVLPQLVQNRDNGYKAVKYDKLVALLIEGIKEQQLQIEQLRIDLNNCNSNKGL